MKRLLLAATMFAAPAAFPAVAWAQAGCTGTPATLTVLKPTANPPYPSQMDIFKAANPCISLDVQEVPFGQLADKISVLAASGSPPDVLVYDGPNTQSYAASGVLLALDPYLPPGLKDDILPASLTEHSWDGKLYSPGLQQTTLALFYNQDMLDKAGIPTPPKDVGAGWKWSDAMAAFAKCQQGTGDDVSVWGLAPSRFGGAVPGFVYRDLLFLRTMGNPKAPEDSSAYKTYWAVSRDGKTAQGWLNTPEAVEGAKFFAGMFNEAKITPKAGIPNAFQDKRACFTIDTSYFIAGLKDVDFKWGVTPLPYTVTPVVHTGSLTLGVTAKSTHKDEAAKFVIAMTTGAAAEDLARTYHILPVMKSLYPKFPELNAYPYKIFTDELAQWGHPRPPSPRFAQYDKVVSDALRDIAYGADAKTRLDQAVRTLGPVLAR